jgi:anthranilate synthase component 1
VSFKTRLLSPKTLLDSSSGKTHPDLLSFIEFKRERYPYLLSSSAARQNNTQYDILLACPQDVLTLNADKSLQLTRASNHSKHDGALTTDPLNESNFFNALEKLYQKDKVINSVVSNDLPFTGGWFVYLSYEMAEEVEPCLTLPSLPIGHPLAVAVRCPAAVIHNKQNDQYIAVAENNFEYLLDELEQDYLKLFNQQSDGQTDANINIKLQSLQEDEVEPYLQQVDKIKRYIVEGDIFQANLSRRWKAYLQSEVDDLDLFRKLAMHNPSSFAAIACLENITIISSSPERLVSLRDGIVETRPIAGTRPRDSNQQSDDALAKELLAHPKEQAEHIMLIDLERNDLGRVCRPGTIEVNELMALESWEHVHHIVSNVRGELDKNKSPIDVLRAVFPGGTITGCPKVRCMEILAELEQEPRGAYTGSLGYINTDGSMDFNILIRTMVRETKNNPKEITFRAGGGIVSDSIAEDELEETRAKAKGLLKIFQ